jgi:[ribosomal protein S18]-alanine N-acetyltransferase
MHTSAGLEFCRLGPQHEAGLARLFEALTAQGDDRYFHPHPFTPEEARRLCRAQGHDLYYVAVADDVLAYGMLRGWDAGYEVPSLGIAVHPRARGTGLARAFMQFLHAASAVRKAPRVRLKVYPQNAPARRLYESLGYRFDPPAGDQLVGHLCLEPQHRV